MSEIEVPASPRALNKTLAPSSRRERIARPAERVARIACFGPFACASEAGLNDLGLMKLVVCHANKKGKTDLGGIGGGRDRARRPRQEKPRSKSSRKTRPENAPKT